MRRQAMPAGAPLFLERLWLKFPPGPLSGLRAVVDVGSVIDVENVYNSRLIIDAVDDPVGPAAP